MCTALLSGAYVYPLFLLVRGWNMELRAYALYGRTVPLSAYLYGGVFFLIPFAARLAASLIFARGTRHSRLYLFVLLSVDLLFFSGVTDAENTVPQEYIVAAGALFLVYYALGFLRVYRRMPSP